MSETLGVQGMTMRTLPRGAGKRSLAMAASPHPEFFRYRLEKTIDVEKRGFRLVAIHGNLGQVAECPGMIRRHGRS